MQTFNMIFTLLRKIIQFSLKPSKNVNYLDLHRQKLKDILKLEEIYTLKNFMFQSNILKPEDIELKISILGLFIIIIKHHHQLKFIEHNQYFGIFKEAFNDSIKIIQNKNNFFKSNEIKFLRTFLDLFYFTVENNIPMEIQVFENRNNLMNSFFFPLISMEEQEAQDLTENPKEFVFYGQDFVDMKKSKTLKCQVIRLFETLCKNADGFHIFACDYLNQVLLYCIYYCLFNDPQHSKLESIYTSTESPQFSFTYYLNLIWGSPRNKFEKSLLKFLGQGEEASHQFPSVLELKQFYERKNRGKVEIASRIMPVDVEGTFYIIL
jgi:hypothetical protein